MLACFTYRLREPCQDAPPVVGFRSEVDVSIFFVQLGGTWVTNILLYRCPAVKVSKSHAGSQHQLSLWQETICSLNGGWEHATRLVLQNDRKCSYALARSKDRECWSKSPKKPDCRRKCLGSQVNESRECHSPVPKLEPKKTFEKNTP